MLLLVASIASLRASQAQQLVQQGLQGLAGPHRHLQSSCDTTPFAELKPVRDPLDIPPHNVYYSSINRVACCPADVSGVEGGRGGVGWY